MARLTTQRCATGQYLKASFITYVQDMVPPISGSSLPSSHAILKLWLSKISAFCGCGVEIILPISVKGVY